MGENLYHADASPFKGGWIILILLAIAGAAWLAWPTASTVQMSVQRLAGLSAVVSLLIACLLMALVGYADGLDEKQAVMAETGQALSSLGGGVDVSIGIGFVLYSAAVVAIAVGVVRSWIQRSKVS